MIRHEGVTALLDRERALVDPPVERTLDGGHGSVGRRLLTRTEHDPATRQRSDLGDPAAHDAGSDHADAHDGHGSMLLTG